MRRLLPLLYAAFLAPALLAQSPAYQEPGVPPALREELRGALASTPHDLFIRDLRQPIPDATVVILENLSPQELKLRAFEEFKVLMIRGMAEFFGRYSGTTLDATKTVASDPPGGNPKPVMVPLGSEVTF
ncbi:MAG TPA: hypothetical protein VJ483_08150 [Holophagaceae bacterium]|nr:hypothetical protein [Holophagaceae bacterium]